MVLDLNTGIIKMENGIIIDPDQSIEEFASRIPKELYHKDDGEFKKGDKVIRLKGVHDSDVAFNLSICAIYGEKLKVVSFMKDEKEWTDEMVTKKYIYSVSDEFEKLLLKLAKDKKDEKYSFAKFSWGRINVHADMKSSTVEFEIVYNIFGR